MEYEAGQLLSGKYRIVRLVGDGGMGSVYEATHEVLGTSVALKFLFPHLARIPGLTERVLREARVSATIRSPHVTQVTDVGQLPNGTPFLVMELLKGESLQRLLDRVQKLPRDQVIDIGLQLLVGLEAAHAIGVVHRDLKPDNVFVTDTDGGRLIKILDFGIAKVRASSEFQNLTRPGAVMGTPEYMAPEQAFSADKADARSDLYSVGVMLYEMLSGVLPARGGTPQEIANLVIAGKVTPLHEHHPGLPQGLVNLIHRAIRANPDERPRSALEMRRALAPFAGELSRAGRMAAAVTAVDTSTRGPVGSSGTEKVPQAQLSAPPVAPTLPPEAPLAAAGAPPGLARTAAMPQVDWPAAPSPGTAKTAPPIGAAAMSALQAPSAPRRRSRAIWWLLLSVLVLGGGAAAAWYVNEQNDIGPPPALPRARGETGVTQITEQIEIDPTDTVTRPRQSATQATTRSSGSGAASHAAKSKAPQPAADAGVPGTPVGIPFPQFQLPPGFPELPKTLPTELPPMPSSIIPPGLLPAIPPGLLPSSWPTNLPQIVPPPGYAPGTPGGPSGDSAKPTPSHP